MRSWGLEQRVEWNATFSVIPSLYAVFAGGILWYSGDNVQGDRWLTEVADNEHCGLWSIGRENMLQNMRSAHTRHLDDFHDFESIPCDEISHSHRVDGDARRVLARGGARVGHDVNKDRIRRR